MDVNAVGVPPPKKDGLWLKRELRPRLIDLAQDRFAKTLCLRRVGALLVKSAIRTDSRAERDMHVDVRDRLVLCRVLVYRAVVHTVR